MSKAYKWRNYRRNRKAKIANAALTGAGAGTLQDRGSTQRGDNATLNPYYNNNFMARYQEYIRWYMTSWEARKLVDIPIQDALREPVEVSGVEDDTAHKLMDAYEAFDVDRQLRRALIQERLLGGSLILGVFSRPESEEVSSPLRPSAIERGDLAALNVVDVSLLQRPVWVQDPFDPDFDRLGKISIQGVETHTSRTIVFDGQSLFSRNRQVLMGMSRVNPIGFGESVLAPLYDLLIRATGTQQGAYHLVNLASCLIVGVKELRALKAVNNKAQAKLEEIIEMLSMYRGAVVDGEDVEFRNYSASFGSVPELVMTFMQLLSAASDIPATRFLGQAPGGLNATGQADLENYYNNIQAWQQQHLKRAQMKLLNWIGAHLWGWNEWKRRSENLELKYKPLWNISAVEQSQVDNTYVQALNALVQAGIIDAPSAMEELKKRDLFKGEVAPGDPLDVGGDDLGLSGLLGGKGRGEEDEQADKSADKSVDKSADKTVDKAREGNRTGNSTGFDESKVKRGGDPKHSGRFSEKDGGGTGKTDKASDKGMDKSEEEKAGDGGARRKVAKSFEELMGPEYKGVKGADAINKLLQEKQGYVKGAFYNPEIREIDLFWGDDTAGLCHILQERSLQDISIPKLLSDLPHAIEYGEVGENQNDPGTRENIFYKDIVIVITYELRGQDTQAVLSACRTKARRKIKNSTLPGGFGTNPILMSDRPNSSDNVEYKNILQQQSEQSQA